MSNEKLIAFDAEQSVLGSVLIDPTVLFRLGRIKHRHFSSRPHQLIWNAFTEMERTGIDIDMLTVSTFLEEHGQSDDTGGFSYLADLARFTPSAANVSAYADIVLDRSHRRTLAKMYSKLSEELTDFDKTPAEHAQAGIEYATATIRNYEHSTSARHISELCEDWHEEYAERLEGKSTSSITTGLTDLDKLLAPKNVVDGALFVVGARPKMGKTALSLKLVDHITGLGHEGLVFSMEMSSTQLVERSLTQLGNVRTNVMYPNQDGQLEATDEELSNMIATLGLFKDRPLYISTQPAIGLAEMELMIRDRHTLSGGKLKAVWVDYLTLMETESRGDRHDLGYAAITKRLKVLAKELNLVVFLLIQLNRGLENRADKRPIPSDGRETGQIEQDCDYWLGIYRDHVYNEMSDPSLTELILRLNRHGPAGTVYAKFAGGRFDNWVGALPVQGKQQRIEV